MQNLDPSPNLHGTRSISFLLNAGVTLFGTVSVCKFFHCRSVKLSEAIVALRTVQLLVSRPKWLQITGAPNCKQRPLNDKLILLIYDDRRDGSDKTI